MSNEIENEIKALRQKNDYLKALNNDLKKQIEVLTKIPYDASKPVSIIEYYGKKYLDLYDDALASRLAKIKEEKIQLQKEYDHLADSEDKVALLASSNHEIDERISKINNIIHDNLMKQEDLKFILTGHQREYARLVKNLEDESKCAYNEMLDELIRNNYQTYDIALNKLLEMINNRLIPANQKAREINEKIKQEVDMVKAKEQETIQENRLLSQEKNELITKKVNLSTESIEAMLDDLASEIERKSQLEKEIKELFEHIKQDHLKKIKDEIEHFQVIELSNHDIALAMDEFLMNIVNELINLDTQTNIQMQKMVELNRLNEKMESLVNVKTEYINTQNDYEYLQALYKEVNNQLEAIEEYVKKYQLALETNPTYQKFCDYYLTLIADRVTATQEKKRLEKELEDLKKYRAEKVSDPFAGPEMAIIKQKMALLTDEIVRVDKALVEINASITKQQAQKELASLMNVIDDAIICQNKLPSLYQKVRDLTMLVDEKYQQLQQIKRQLQEYEDLCLEIEALENEINH